MGRHSSSSTSSSHSSETINGELCCKIREQYAKVLCAPLKRVPELGNADCEEVCTYALDLNYRPLQLNGFKVRSPLANYGFGSAEIAYNACEQTRKYVNLFEINIPDTPNYADSLSRGQAYVKFLDNEGLNSAIVNFNYWGEEPFVAAVHTQNIGMNPVRFARKVARALKCAGMTYKKHE